MSDRFNLHNGGFFLDVCIYVDTDELVNGGCLRFYIREASLFRDHGKIVFMAML